MKTTAAIAFTALLTMIAVDHTRAADGKIAVVAAENFYGDIVKQIGGDRVEVTSIITNPDQDPHLFETSPGVVRQIADAQIVVYNGADYDAWMEKLVKASPKAGRSAIVVAELTGTKAGENPHLWYEPGTTSKLAKALADAFAKADAAHASEFTNRVDTFLASLKPINEKIAAVAKKYGGVTVTASEPVFGYMATALKLKMRNERFQLAIMNDTEPSARDVAAFEQDLRSHRVRLMFFNKQASNKAVQRLVEIAHASKVPIVGVTETQPPGVSFQDWIMGEISDTETALAQSVQ
jgi:zinc/manganese transport system substrate-binding protein